MLKRITAILTAILLLLAALPALAVENYVTSVTLDLQALGMLPGSSGQQLHVTVTPDNAVDSRVYWMSSNQSVATVDNNGYVTPRGTGTTEITAQTANGQYDICVVSVVNNPVTQLTLSHSELTIEERTAYVMQADVLPKTADNLDITWQSSNKKVAVVNSNGKIFTKEPGTCWISATANGGIDVIARCKLTVTASDKPKKYVALTFDDGPCANTLEIVKILEEYDVHATFFWLGELVEEYPDYVRIAYSRGHEIANHSYGHKTLTDLSVKDAVKQMTDADAAIKAVIGIEASVYRAPGGSVEDDIIRACGKPFIGWNVDTHDWKYRDPEHVWTFIAQNTDGDDIVLMHDIRPTTAEAMHKAIPYLLEQGFTLVTVSEFLTLQNNNSSVVEP